MFMNNTAPVPMGSSKTVDYDKVGIYKTKINENVGISVTAKSITT